MKKERWSDGGSGEAATAACEGAGGRRMSQCEWDGVRAMKGNGDMGRHGAPAWDPCRTHGLQLPQGKSKKHQRLGFTQNEKAEN